MRPECLEQNQTSVGDLQSHPYKKKSCVNGFDIDVLLDTESRYTLVKSSVAIRIGLQMRPIARPLYGLGSESVPSVETVGETNVEIIIDAVSAGPVLILVVPNEAQWPDAIVGRKWLDSPRVAFKKDHGCLILYNAKVLKSVVETTVITARNDSEYLHVVDEATNIELEPLFEHDFAFVNKDVSDGEHSELLSLLNEFWDCFAKGLYELVLEVMRRRQKIHQGNLKSCLL